jgi:3-oxoacyl-[acyl-carrier-protein] synthase II
MASRRVLLSSVRAVVVAADIITAFGKGLDACWEGLLANRTAVSRLSRFETGAFHSDYAATIPGLDYQGSTSLTMQMLGQLYARSGDDFPADAKLLLATTKGEIDLLEKSIIAGTGDAAESALDRLLGKVADLTGVRGGAMVLSAACTSSAAAAARAAAMIRGGNADCVLVVACDSVTEFIYSGFSSLMALDKIPARPFDKNRAGLSVGEAAAFVLIMSEERARREKRTILGELAGWGLSDDANHMTGPSRASEGLILAMDKALHSAAAEAQQVGFIAAHGTGTVYNDAMEMLAFRTVFRGRKLPVYSIKGAIGHTMGAAGLVEMIVALRALRENIVPPTVNLVEADDDARGWAAGHKQDFGRNSLALLTSAGFSGVNTALVLA